MANIVITTTAEEHAKVLEALKQFINETVAVSQIAKQAKMNPNRVRYVLIDLEEAKKIRKIPTKAFNKRYIRYKYEIV